MPHHATITLSPELAAAIEGFVASGAYPDASAVIAAGLEALVPADQRIEAWLRDEVLPVAEMSQAGTAPRIAAEDVSAALDARHAAWKARQAG